jgi:hypothetical protein
MDKIQIIGVLQSNFVRQRARKISPTISRDTPSG